MTKIKLCGLSRKEDIEAANALRPDYIGFVFAEKSKRHVSCEQAAALRQTLCPDIRAVGVFVNEKPGRVAELLSRGVIDIAQLHGAEDGAYLAALRRLTDKPILQAFRIRGREDVTQAANSAADFVLLDSGAGTGTAFDWRLLADIHRPYFLAGGLDTDNVREAIRLLQPYAVDVSSGIETDGVKDKKKMTAFVAAVRKEEKR